MKKHKAPTPPGGKLRPQAEKRLKERGLSETNDLSRTDARALVHELQVHQIELEMQNGELRRAQAEAQEAQQKFAELFDFAPVGYFLVDQNGLIREANLAAASLLGRDRSRVSGQPFAKLIAPDCRPHFAAFWSHLWETDTKQSCELALLKQEQGLRPVVLDATVRSGLPGGGVRVLLAVTDITTRKQTEEALQAAYHGLERRVEERTAELQRSDVQLAHEIEERKRPVEHAAKQLRFETLIADLSSKFVNVPAGNVDREIMDAERRLCEVLDLDIAAIWQWSAGPPGCFALTHYYSAQDGPQPSMRLSDTDFSWFRQLMLEGRIVPISSLEEMPAEAALDRENLRRLGVKSNLCLPLRVGGEPSFGILGLNTTRAECDWPEALMKRLRLVAQIFANALARKRADQALRESEELNRATFEQAAVGLAHVGTDGRWLRVNDKLCAMVGYSRDELLKLTFQDITHPEDLEKDLDFVRQVLSGEIQNYSMEKRYLCKDHSLVWINLSVSLVRTAAGAPLHFISVVQDITERKRAELEAQELCGNLTHLTRVNTLSVLSGSLAHELNQPLGIILSNAQAAQELLLQQPPDVAEVQAILSDIVAADRHASEVIERLRAMLKRGQVSLQPLALNHVLDEVLHLTQADLIGRGVTVVCELAPDLPPIAGDRVQLQQVALNLILNAADAMATHAPEARRLHLQTRLHQGRVRTSVRDEGGGLPADVERLFEPFYTTKPQGLGLGLAICRSILAGHHGRLWAEPHPERGAIFHFELPVAGSLDKP
jgi:PAS domain S-box-containing protein